MKNIKTMLKELWEEDKKFYEQVAENNQTFRIWL